MQYLIGLVLFAFAALLALLIWKHIKIWRLITTMTPTRTDRIKPGLVEVEGTVMAGGDVIISPYTQKECVYYQFLVEEKRKTRGNGSTQSHWRTIVDDEQSAPCLVKDSYGTIEVDLEFANFHLSSDFKARSGALSSTSPELERLLQERYGKTSKGKLFSKTCRYVEKALEVGDPIYVLGYAREIDGRLIITNHEGYGREITAGHRPPPHLWRGIPPFTVTDKGEGHISKKYLGVALILSLATSVVIALGILCFMVKQSPAG